MCIILLKHTHNKSFQLTGNMSRFLWIPLLIILKMRTLSIEVFIMTTLNATDARLKLYSLIDETASTHEPILITGKRTNAVLLSESDWKAINETLHLLSIPGMRESIKEGMEKKLSESSKALDW